MKISRIALTIAVLVAGCADVLGLEDPMPVTGTTPACTSGVCCTPSGTLEPDTTMCATSIEYGCDGVCGGTAQQRTVEQRCSGLSATCEGARQEGPWVTLSSCAADDRCEADTTAARCTACPDGCDATGCSDARNRLVVVLVDASGSMLSTRGDGKTRFDVAKDLAVRHVESQAGPGLGGVAVFTFEGDGIIARTSGFVGAADAAGAIRLLGNPFGFKALAGSVCDGMDRLLTSGGPGIARILYLLTDGAENNTAMSHPCFGRSSVSKEPPFDAGSWESKVYAKATTSVAPVAFTTDLFLYQAGGDEVFSVLARDTGGTLRVIVDDQPVE